MKGAWEQVTSNKEQGTRNKEQGNNKHVNTCAHKPCKHLLTKHLTFNI